MHPGLFCPETATAANVLRADGNAVDDELAGENVKAWGRRDWRFRTGLEIPS